MQAAFTGRDRLRRKVLNNSTEACRKISLQLGLFNLPPGLRELARKRMENPELSLTELGEAMEPPLGKSAVNHRLRRLMQIASELDQQQSGVH